VLLELSCELKKRKKFEPTSIARPAASTASISVDDVIVEGRRGVGGDERHRPGVADGVFGRGGYPPCNPLTLTKVLVYAYRGSFARRPEFDAAW
jgi:hypothetical protein